jgi:hypothetical protein
MAEGPIDLVRLAGEGNSVVLRLAGKGPRRGPTGTGASSYGSKPRPAQNATAASRSSTTTPAWSIR